MNHDDDPRCGIFIEFPDRPHGIYRPGHASRSMGKPWFTAMGSEGTIQFDTAVKQPIKLPKHYIESGSPDRQHRPDLYIKRYSKTFYRNVSVSIFF